MNTTNTLPYPTLPEIEFIANTAALIRKDRFSHLAVRDVFGPTSQIPGEAGFECVMDAIKTLPTLDRQDEINELIHSTWGAHDDLMSRISSAAIRSSVIFN